MFLTMGLYMFFYGDISAFYGALIPEIEMQLLLKTPFLGKCIETTEKMKIFWC